MQSIIDTPFCFNAKGSRRKERYFVFYYDKDYLSEFDVLPNEIHLEDAGSDHSGTFFFQATDTLFHLNPKKVLCLKEFVRSSKFYNKHKTKKLDDYRLWEYLNRYQIFLVKENENKKYYLDVFAYFVIE